MSTPQTTLACADFIHPLEVQGLRGRVMQIPPHGRYHQEVLMVYGHHSSLERWWGLAQNCADYGTLTMPDLPGFGGMDSFYRQGKTASLDNYADFLADFVRAHYQRDEKFTALGISFGFLVITRMLQRHPELTGRVEMLISAAGFMHRDDFAFSPARCRFYMTVAHIMRYRPTAAFFKAVCLNPAVLRVAYRRTSNAKKKFAETTGDNERFERMMAMEIDLWHSNDVRSYMQSTIELLGVDNTRHKVPLPVWAVYSETDQYFNFDSVKKHMKQVFDKFVPLPIDMQSHVVSVIADKEDTAVLMPEMLRQAIIND